MPSGDEKVDFWMKSQRSTAEFGQSEDVQRAVIARQNADTIEGYNWWPPRCFVLEQKDFPPCYSSIRPVVMRLYQAQRYDGGR